MFIRASIMGSLILMLCACSTDQPGNPDNQITANLVNIDSCQVVLIRNDQTPGQEEIQQYQSAVIDNRQPLVNLEKLGWAYISLARRTYDDGYYNLALDTSKCIKTKSDDHDAALMLQAYVSHQLHRFKDAEILAQELVDTRGYWFEYGLLGDALMEQGQLDAAELAYQVMLNQRPGPQAYSRAAHLRWLTGDLSGAIEMAQLTVKSYGSGQSEVASWAKTKLGYYLFLNGDLYAANKIIKQTIELNNEYAPALFIKGRLDLALNKPEKAIIKLTRAVELNPLPEYQWILYEALTTAGQHKLAQTVKLQFEKTAKTQDPRTYALYLATSPLSNNQALKLATDELNQRQDVFSLDAMAWSLYANNEITSALSFMDKALANNTHDARLYYHAALINLATDNRLQANRWFIKALDGQHMLLPSEKSDLQEKFAKFQSHQSPSEANTTYVSRDNLKIIGDQNENSM